MRTFYIFKVNNVFQTIYNEKSSVIYKIYSEIYNSNNEEFIKNYKLFEKITIPFDTQKINNYILSRHYSDLHYRKKSNIHIIDNINETSNITINKTYLKLKSDVNINSFIKDLMNINDYLFVVDFDNKDYFWLNNQVNKILV